MASMRSTLSALVILIGFVLAVEPVHAAPEEIQVYLDDITAPGGFGMDLHNNFVISGSDTPEYPGALPPEHLYRLTPEFYYGVSETFELGLYVLSSVTPGFDARYDGAKLRLKYIAAHDSTAGPFWGANLEIGRTDRSVSERPWNAELKGIYGYRTDPWLIAINANFDAALSAGGDPVALEITTKIARRTGVSSQVGIESYNDLGPLRDLARIDRNSQTLYAVVDTQLGDIELNAGIGRGLTTMADRWVLKFIVGMQF